MSSQTVETINVSDNSTVLHVNMNNVTKLTATNLIMWSRQVHSLLDGYALPGYVNGSTEIPPATVTEDGVVSTNDAYVKWKRQDQLIYSALLGAISHSVQSLLSATTTAAEIWSTLSSVYAKPSRGHILQLHHQLKQWTKGSKSIDDYLQGLTSRFDQIALLGKPLDQEDMIEYVIAGLPEEYKTVTDQIEGRDTTPPLTEVHEKLINHELKLATKPEAPPSLPVTAKAAQFRGNNNHNNRNHGRSNNRTNNNNWNRQNRNQNQQYTPHPYLGRCHICGVHGHSARTCSQLQLQGTFGNPNQSSVSSFAPWQPRANMASAQMYNANNWLLDSGATYHLTSDLNNLALHQPYTGGEEVMIADGTGMQISHTGSALLPTPSRTLALRDVLCVPNVHKNLIYVYRMCNTNKVSVEFFPAHFQVKDLSTGVQLLQGRTRNELYEWPISTVSPSSFYTAPMSKTDLSSCTRVLVTQLYQF